MREIEKRREELEAELKAAGEAVASARERLSVANKELDAFTLANSPKRPKEYVRKDLSEEWIELNGQQGRETKSSSWMDRLFGPRGQ
ncbi:MAG: hypothetical protein ABIB98_02490 [bacterium]